MFGLFDKVIIIVLWFLVFTKLLLFWLWLWQLKDYHWGRFRAHFETQAAKKIFSGFWRMKYPKFTKKIISLVLAGLLLGTCILGLVIALSVKTAPFRGCELSLGSCERTITNEKLYYGLLLLFIVLEPIIISLLVLLFQIPTVVWRNWLLAKAQQKREKFKNLIVIGITGSYGKTSTKEFLDTILREKFGDKVLKTKEHINAEIGIAQTILKELNENHKIFIAEIGAYERGKIKEVCEMLQPKIGILTGINEQHMSTFGSQENIIKAKYELIESLPPNGLVIFNGSNKHCENLYHKTTIPKKLVPPATNTFPTIVENVLPWERENVLMAVAAAEALVTTKEEINRAVGKLKSPFQVKRVRLEGGQEINVIDSTYSVNSDGVIKHLDYLKKKWPAAKKIIVMPCLIELGRASKEVHYRIGQKIGKVCDLAIITTKDRFKEIKQGALNVGMKGERVLLLERPKGISEKIKNFTNPNDIILLEGRLPKLISDKLIIK